MVWNLVVSTVCLTITFDLAGDRECARPVPATIGDRAADAGFQATFHDIYDRFRSDSRS